MEIFLQDPGEIPLPPGEVRIRHVKVAPTPDTLRVRVFVETDPFQKRPNLDLSILDPGQNEVASASVIEPMNRKMELTMHLPSDSMAGEYCLAATLFYIQPLAEGESENPYQTKKDISHKNQVSFYWEPPGKA